MALNRSTTTIATRLRLGLGLIFLAVTVLAAQTWRQTDRIDNQRRAIYEGPFEIRRALGRLSSDVFRIQLRVKEFHQSTTQSHRMSLIDEMALLEVEVERELGIIDRRHLGDGALLDALRSSLSRWTAFRNENIRLLGEVPTSEAARDTALDQALSSNLDLAVERAIDRVSADAAASADAFYARANEARLALNRQLAVGLTIILLIAGLVFFRLQHVVSAPLRALLQAVEGFRRGDWQARSGFVSADEFGTLSSAFNEMADTLATQAWIQEHAVNLAEVMLRESQAHAFCHQVLRYLMAHTEAQVAAIYVLNQAKTEFEHYESIGLSGQRRDSYSATTLEGEFGPALSSGKLERITEVPADTPFVLALVSGELRPQEILTLPLQVDGTTIAVISLASAGHFAARAIQLLESVANTAAARLNGVLAYDKIQQLAEQQERQNRELDAQAAELTLQNAELERQRRQVLEANRLKSDFLSNMSHELRTPLNSVIALSGVLHRRLAGAMPAEEYSYLEIIERNGRHLLALINDVLDLSRIESGHQEVSIYAFSLSQLVSELCDELRPLAVEKQLTLISRVSDALPTLRSDPEKCRHILQNLLANAIKFTDQGQIIISAELVPGDGAAEAELRVAVCDTGIGIAADQLPHIFEEFRQADGSTSRTHGGTGLGLTIARKYALLLSGRISVRSEVNLGSTFTLHLPLNYPHDQQLEAPAPTRSRADTTAAIVPGHGQTILLVDDNEPVLIQLADVLETHGYCVQVAHDGDQALAQIERSLPDAMILDLMMPGTDGFEVLRSVRAQARTASLPVLVLSAKHVSKEESSILSGNHVRQWVQKGDIDRSRLLAEVARMLAPAEPLPGKREHRDRHPPRVSPPIVLIVEDNADNLTSARAILEPQYRVIAASDGQEGIELARGQQPDVVLMDIAMPILSGVDTLRRMRADASLRHIPVIAATASAMKGDREAILAQGFDGYVSKPLIAETLLQTLSTVLG